MKGSALNQVTIEKKRQEEDYIVIQLKKYGIVEEEVVFPTKGIYLEAFYSDRSAKRKELDLIPLFADFFPNCQTPLKDDIYTLSIKEVYREQGIKKERILIKSVPVKWETEV